MNDMTEQVYGRGWAFPPRFTLEDGVVMVAGHEELAQSMDILFSTQPGERIMRPEFGCDFQSAMFENISGNLVADLTSTITDAVLRQEPRVELKSIMIAPDALRSETLLVHCVYRPRGHEATDRLVGTLGLNSGNRWSAR